jgi:hypothetical protein
MLPRLEEEHIGQLGLNRRQSRTIPPPRKWRKLGLSQRVCPECRAIVASISDGHWHLQKQHDQGKGVDLEGWGSDLRDELDEFIFASKGRRGLIEEDTAAGGVRLMSVILLAAVVTLLVFGVIYWQMG